MELSKSLLYTRKELKDEREAHDKDNKNHTRNYELLEEKYDAIKIDRDFYKDRWDKLQKGGLGYCENQVGQVIDMFRIERDFDTSFPQDIPKEIGTPLYARYPFYQIKKGLITIDKDMHRKYKLGGLL